MFDHSLIRFEYTLDECLNSHSNTGTYLTVSEQTQGTKEDEECSSRGLCDRSTGLCHCFNGFGSSNGVGGPGGRGDCSYFDIVRYG